MGALSRVLRAQDAVPKREAEGAGMIGIVDVGGGLRGIFGAAVFDRCLDEGVAFDYVLGVSAGSGNAVAFLAGQRGRNRLFYTEYAARKGWWPPTLPTAPPCTSTRRT